MTLRELYAEIDGDYDKAIQILMLEKLMDKHIRKLPANPIFSALEAAEESMDETALFDSAHAIKGVCANLGLVKLAGLASDITEEFRPGNERKITDDEVKEIIDELFRQYNKTVERINEYEQTA